mmetsp:Transcript_23236/g.75889  ORF Transcript_23236/g.75889 Transcript_23236/m.75889 type:complete len:205 (+) Transcript_23236:28-642(+)
MCGVGPRALSLPCICDAARGRNIEYNRPALVPLLLAGRRTAAAVPQDVARPHEQVERDHQQVRRRQLCGARLARRHVPGAECGGRVCAKEAEGPAATHAPGDRALARGNQSLLRRDGGRDPDRKNDSHQDDGLQNVDRVAEARGAAPAADALQRSLAEREDGEWQQQRQREEYRADDGRPLPKDIPVPQKGKPRPRSVQRPQVG